MPWNPPCIPVEPSRDWGGVSVSLQGMRRQGTPRPAREQAQAGTRTSLSKTAAQQTSVNPFHESRCFGTCNSWITFRDSCLLLPTGVKLPLDGIWHLSKSAFLGRSVTTGQRQGCAHIILYPRTGHRCPGAHFPCKSLDLGSLYKLWAPLVPRLCGYVLCSVVFQ